MSGARKVEHNENHKECEHSRLVKRGHEVVCRDCGLVISEFELEPTPRRNTFSLWDYTSFANTADRLTSRERTELAAATQIDLLASKLMLPKQVVAQAVVEARKILKGMRSEGKVRLTAMETAIVSLWNACKIMKVPLSMHEYAGTLNAMGIDYNGNRVYKLLNRASRLVDLPNKIMKPKDYIPRITTKLVGKVGHRYLSMVEQYARTIAANAEEELRGRNPVYSAAAAVCAADEILGERIGRSAIAEAVDAGAGLASLATRLRGLAPPPPAEAFDLVFAYVRASRVSLLAEA